MESDDGYEENLCMIPPKTRRPFYDSERDGGFVYCLHSLSF